MTKSGFNIELAIRIDDYKQLNNLRPRNVLIHPRNGLLASLIKRRAYYRGLKVVKSVIIRADEVVVF